LLKRKSAAVVQQFFSIPSSVPSGKNSIKKKPLRKIPLIRRNTEIDNLLYVRAGYTARD
jgi:hypothetical protein